MGEGGLGMLTLIAGDPGVGKSFLSLYIASLVTTAGCTPDDGLFSLSRCCENGLAGQPRPDPRSFLRKQKRGQAFIYPCKAQLTKEPISFGFCNRGQ